MSKALGNGVVASTKRERLRFWSAWQTWLAFNFPTVHLNLHQVSRSDQIELLAAFAHHVRSGGVSRRTHQVRTQTVQVALRAISTKIQLDGQQSPVVDSQGKYPKKISELLESYRREDPPPTPKLAVPLSVPRFMLMNNYSSKSAKEKSTGDMTIIAFYFLLRVGEYTYHRPSEKRQTKQFRVSDIALWHNTTRLDPRLPLQTLYKLCTAATMSISNQKNGKRSQVIHQEAIHNEFCPIRALIRRIHHIQANTSDPTTIISTYFQTPYCKGRAISANDINQGVKSAVTRLGLANNGLHQNLVGSHSLRAGGAMAMHLQGIDTNTIKKMGRWSSDTFLMYIHEQMSAFSTGVSQKMSTHVNFHNIAFQPAAPPSVYKTARSA